MIYVYLHQGGDCCSLYSVSFHYVDPVTMHVIDHLLYRTSVYGHHQVAPSQDMFKPGLSWYQNSELRNCMFDSES